MRKLVFLRYMEMYTVLLACTRYVPFIIVSGLVWDLHGRIQAERLLFSYRLVEQTIIYNIDPHLEVHHCYNINENNHNHNKKISMRSVFSECKSKKEESNIHTLCSHHIIICRQLAGLCILRGGPSSAEIEAVQRR